MAGMTPEQIRAAALTWIDQVTLGGQLPVTREQLTHDFCPGGERLPLVDKAKGIRKPARLGQVISIMTSAPKLGRPQPYEEPPGDSDVAHYGYTSNPRGESENQGLRDAMRDQLPLIWLVGITPGVFEAKFPVYVIADQPDNHQVVLAVGESMLQLFEVSRTISSGDVPSALENELFKEYAIGTARRRKHQHQFARNVMRAYEEHCAVCKFDDRRLLDAAHIIPDREAHSTASVRNGLALCKIHHAAYDNNMLGIDPDSTVHINIDLLHKIDGPMLKHGLQEHHGQRLMWVPHQANDKPDPDALAERFAQFRAAH